MPEIALKCIMLQSQVLLVSGDLFVADEPNQSEANVLPLYQNSSEHSHFEA